MPPILQVTGLTCLWRKYIKWLDGYYVLASRRSVMAEVNTNNEFRGKCERASRVNQLVSILQGS